MTTRKKNISVKGSLAGLPPLLKEAKSGTKWCKFHIDVKGLLWGVSAFHENAVKLCDAKLQAGAQLALKGTVEDDEAREMIANIILLPHETEALESPASRWVRWWGSKQYRQEAWQRELAYQAHYGRVLAYDADGRKWFWPVDDVVDYQGKPYIKLEARFLSDGTR